MSLLTCSIDAVLVDNCKISVSEAKNIYKHLKQNPRLKTMAPEAVPLDIIPAHVDKSISGRINGDLDVRTLNDTQTTSSAINGTRDINNSNGTDCTNGIKKAKPTPSEEALSLITSKLSKMSALKALLEVDIDHPKGPVFIDGRSDPAQLLRSSLDEPACRVKIKPLYIKRFIEGKLEPRYGLFKDGFFNPDTLPTGEIKVAVKFGDLLCPTNPTHPLSYTEGLPVPTEDLDQVRADMKKWGYGLVKNALSPEEIYKYREALRQQAEGEVKAGVSVNDGGPKAPNQRVWTLINKGQEFLDFLEHPLIDEIVPDVLGDNSLIHS